MKTWMYTDSKGHARAVLMHLGGLHAAALLHITVLLLQITRRSSNSHFRPRTMACHAYYHWGRPSRSEEFIKNTRGILVNQAYRYELKIKIKTNEEEGITGGSENPDHRLLFPEAGNVNGNGTEKKIKVNK